MIDTNTRSRNSENLTQDKSKHTQPSRDFPIQAVENQRTKKIPGQNSLAGEFFQTFKKYITSMHPIPEHSPFIL